MGYISPQSQISITRTINKLRKDEAYIAHHLGKHFEEDQELSLDGLARLLRTSIEQTASLGLCALPRSVGQLRDWESNFGLPAGRLHQLGLDDVVHTAEGDKMGAV